MADSSVTIVGNITRDPELRFTKSGTAVVGFGVAVNRRWYNNSTNEYDEETSFFDVEAWKDLAENVGDSLSKGDRVIVSGRLDQQSWEDKEGNKRSKVVVVADEVGASLRWATATLAKADRRGGGNAGPSVQASSAPSYDEDPF